MLTAEELIPDPAVRERIFREACEEAARARGRWLTIEEAAQYIRRSKRELYRLIKAYGIPKNDLTNCLLLADLDALLAKHMTTDGKAIIDFPSLALSRNPQAA